MGTKRPTGKVCIAPKISSKATEAAFDFTDLPLQPELGFLRHASSSMADSSHMLVLVFVENKCDLIYTCC